MTENTLNLLPLADELEAFISNTIPNSKTVSKYGGTLFTLNPEAKEGQFCGIFIYKEHVQISFSKGAALTDPNKLLGGSGKHRRHINLTSTNEIDLDELEKLLKQAAEL